MSSSIRRLTLAAIIAASATSMLAVQMAEAGGVRRQRTRDGIMRLGAPANGNGNAGAATFVDRTGGVSLRSQADVRAFALSSGSDRSGPAL